MAKKFSFRLEPLLNIKAFRAKQAKEELMAILYLRTKKESEIEERNNYLSSLFEHKLIYSKASEIQAFWYHINYVKEQIANLENEKKQLIEIENLKREKFNAAMKEEKILEKLKEKKRQAYFEDINREEIKQLDEIAQKKFQNFEMQ